MLSYLNPDVFEPTAIGAHSEVRKSATETIRVTFDQLAGRPLVSVRVWERHRSGEQRPTRAGFTCRIELLPEIAKAIGKAYGEAQSQRLVP